MSRAWLPALLGMLMAVAGAGLLVAFYPHGPHWCSVLSSTGHDVTFGSCAPKIVGAIVGASLLAAGMVSAVAGVVAGLRSSLKRRRP